MSVLGLDVGTSTCKGAVISGSGVLLGQHQVPYAHKVLLRDGAAELPAGIFWDSAVQVVRALASAAERTDPIEALAVSAHGETLIPVDASGDPLCAAMLSMDRRCAKEAAQLEERVGRERIYAATGAMMHPQFPVPKIMWLQNNRPDLVGKVHHYASAQDFIYEKLGFPQISDRSAASRFGGLDIRTGGWSREILSAAGIAPQLLPEPVWGGTALGVISDPIARSLGLRGRVLAVAGGHDQPCAAIGMGVQDRPAITVSAGSYECAARATREPLNNEQGLRYGLNSYCHALEGQYITLAFFVSGMMVQWYLDTFCGEEKAAAAREDASIHQWMEDRAMREPTGVCITPHIFGSMNPEWSEKTAAKITGLRAGITKADLYRAVLEGTCCELDLNLRVLERLTGPVDALCMTGGGTRSDCWMHLRADITGKEITVVEDGAEASCVGAAILAGMGLGAFAGPEDAHRRLRRNTRLYRPEHLEAYARQKEAYLALHKAGLLD